MIENTKIQVDKGNVAFTRSFINNQYDLITGKILTVIDAVMTGEQNKATKDIIRNIMSDSHQTIWDLCWMKEVKDGITARQWYDIVPLTEEQKNTEIFYFER